VLARCRPHSPNRSCELELTESNGSPAPSSSASKGKARARPASQVHVEDEVVPELPKEGGYIGEMVVQAMAMSESSRGELAREWDAHTRCSYVYSAGQGIHQGKTHKSETRTVVFKLMLRCLQPGSKIIIKRADQAPPPPPKPSPTPAKGKKGGQQTLTSMFKVSLSSR
jgi:hypothetical protein